MMANRPEVTSAYVLEGSEPTLVETRPTTSFRSLADGLASLGLGPNDLAHVVATHIHLDHARGVGRVADAFPRATARVHHPGPQPLAPPTKPLRARGRGGRALSSRRLAPPAMGGRRPGRHERDRRPRPDRADPEHRDGRRAAVRSRGGGPVRPAVITADERGRAPSVLAEAGRVSLAARAARRRRRPPAHVEGSAGTRPSPPRADRRAPARRL